MCLEFHTWREYIRTHKEPNGYCAHSNQNWLLHASFDSQVVVLFFLSFLLFFPIRWVFFFLLSSYVLSVCASIPNRESGVAFFSVSFRFYVRFILFTRFVVRPELDTESNTNVYLCRSLGCVYCWSSLSFGCVSNTRHCQRMRNFGIVWHFYVCICVCAINLTSHLCWQFAMLFITHSLKW